MYVPKYEEWLVFVPYIGPALVGGIKELKSG